MKLISIVIPVFNEEKNVPLIYKEFEKIAKGLKGYEFEIIFVDDGSKDKSWDMISKLKNSSKSIKIRALQFSRNFGHQQAIDAGLQETTGDCAIMIDADLQHPPELSIKMIDLWEKGYLIVNTLREEKNFYNNFFKNVTSHLFYFLINKFTSLKLKYGEADYRLIDRKVIDVLNKLEESPKFYRGLVNWVGFKSIDIKYFARNRKYGSTGYTFRKMLELARYAMTSFSMKPLKVIISIGTVITFLSGVSATISLYLKLFVDYEYISNYVLLAFVILFCTGIMIIFQGIMALYIIDIFNASRKRPTYIISNKLV